MDVQMPVMGGFEATAKIREWEKEQRLPRTPIVALTAHAMLGDREKCIQAQMDEYLSKPLKQNSLIQVILKQCATLGGPLLERGGGLLGTSMDDDRVQSRMFGPTVTQRPQLLEARATGGAPAGNVGLPTPKSARTSVGSSSASVGLPTPKSARTVGLPSPKPPQTDGGES